MLANDPIRHARRVDRLTRELADEGVRLVESDHLDAGGEGHAIAQAMALEELVYARHIPVHEGRRPPYGCLIVNDLDLAESHFERVLETTAPDLDRLRPMADGRTAFVVRDLAGRTTIGLVLAADELEVVRLSGSLPAIAIQRLPNGSVKVFDGREIATSESLDWSVRPYAATMISPVAQALNLPAAVQGRMLKVIADLLEFSYHSLSARRIGATLVLALQGSCEDFHDSLAGQGIELAARLNATDALDQKMLTNLIASIDGACLLESDGTVSKIETKLSNTDDSVRAVAEHGGTRHTSARRFSFDHAAVLVFVVSADGPVTLFSDGAPTLSLGTDHAQSWRLRLRHELARQVEDVCEERHCPNCAKRVQCVGSRGPGGASRSIACPVCDHDGLFDVADALSVYAVPVKSW